MILINNYIMAHYETILYCIGVLIGYIGGLKLYKYLKGK